MTRRPKSTPRREPAAAASPSVRIIGGRFRGRRLAYSGDERTRPMKDRVREALMNLIGPQVKGMCAVDLFAGTGALGLEALSRGAARAIFVEQHYPTAELIRRNIDTLDVGKLCEVVPANALLWLKRRPAMPDSPWLVLFSPPFDFFLSRRSETLSLIADLIATAPPGSVLAVETPDSFDASELPRADRWTVRVYSPAQLAIYRVNPPRLSPS